MGIYKTLGISLLIIFLSSVLTYIFNQELVITIFNSKFVAYNELGFFAAIFETTLHSISEIKVALIIIITSLIGGILYKSRNSFIIGFTSFLILGLILLVIIWKYFGAYWNILTLNPFPIIIDIIFTIIIAMASASIPGAIYHILLKRGEKETVKIPPEMILFKCPKCNREYQSNPIICISCGYNFSTGLEYTKNTDN